MRAGRLRAGQWLALSFGILVVSALLGIGLAFVALGQLSDARHRAVDVIDPAATITQSLDAALLNQETGVRGYLLGGRPEYLTPYREGRRAEARAYARLVRLAREAGSGAQPPEPLAALRREIDAWQRSYAEPAIRKVEREGPRAVAQEVITEGTQRFRLVRRSLRRLEQLIVAARADARHDLHVSARNATAALIFASVLLLAALGVAALVVRRMIATPIGQLARQARAVAHGDFRRGIEPQGPRDLVALGQDVEAMRRRIVVELEAMQAAQERIEQQAADLQRSNEELEQFAYVASHDLQEPLRKVTSFCQMLERRYRGQLDERADQYIHYAVDGAKRMQVLINDLLAFSRVGRLGAGLEPVDAGELVAQARANLAQAIEETGARIEVEGELPVVRGDRSLLALVFGNLIGNGIKFADPARSPLIRVSARRDGDEHVFSISDNGIGIDPQYGERIFVIFQRLHTKDAYEGTGIGLAMCRKVIEYHGGRIWLAERRGGEHAGATFCFTLPAVDEPGDLA